MFSAAELEALELMVKAGRVAPTASFQDAIPEVKKYILDLAKRLTDNPSGQE